MVDTGWQQYGLLDLEHQYPPSVAQLVYVFLPYFSSCFCMREFTASSLLTIHSFEQHTL